MAQLPCSRTISTAPEVTLLPSMFCQPIDIGIDLADNSTQNIPNMEGYPCLLNTYTSPRDGLLSGMPTSP
jgi:hypothetical protein